MALFNLEREKERKTVRKPNERTHKNPLPWLSEFGVRLIRDVNAQTSCTGFGTDTGPAFP